jgi:hypothetical protein
VLNRNNHHSLDAKDHDGSMSPLNRVFFSSRNKRDQCAFIDPRRCSGPLDFGVRLHFYESCRPRDCRMRACITAGWMHVVGLAKLQVSVSHLPSMTKLQHGPQIQRPTRGGSCSSCYARSSIAPVCTENLTMRPPCSAIAGPTASVGRELNVRYVLEGSVQRSLRSTPALPFAACSSADLAIIRRILLRGSG